MVFKLERTFSMIALLALCVSFTSCNEEEFYDKEDLPGVGRKLPPPPVNPGGEGSEDYILLRDYFFQNSAAQGKVDIVWVIDNSGSMEDVQASLAANFDSFIRDFVAEGADFKMGITTTDPRSGVSGGDGTMFGGNHLNKLTDEAYHQSSSKFYNDFANYIKVGIGGSGSERGLNGGKRFLERYGNSFLREDAHLALIFVSDEEDQSLDTVDQYTSFFRELKAQQGMVKAYSIVTTRNTGNRWDTIGTRYLGVTSNTQGLSAHVQDNFADTLTEIGSTIVRLTGSFALSGIPYDLNSFQVAVDGVDVKTGWSYDEPTKSIKFDSGSIPPEGAEVTVSYFAEK